MAKIGQILWKVADPYAFGGYTTTKGISEKAFYGEEYQQLVPENTKWLRMSVQAPPGTRFKISQSSSDSGDQEIMVGRTGIYELPPGVEITAFHFFRPSNIVKNEEQTLNEIIEGQNILLDNENIRLQKMLEAGIYTVTQEGVQNNLSTGINNEAMWTAYVEALNSFQNEYLEGIFHYNLGINGVYQESLDGKLDLINVIIDYTAENTVIES